MKSPMDFALFVYYYIQPQKIVNSFQGFKTFSFAVQSATYRKLPYRMLSIRQQALFTKQVFENQVVF